MKHIGMFCYSDIEKLGGGNRFVPSCNTPTHHWLFSYNCMYLLCFIPYISNRSHRTALLFQCCFIIEYHVITLDWGYSDSKACPLLLNIFNNRLIKLFKEYQVFFFIIIIDQFKTDKGYNNRFISISIWDYTIGKTLEECTCVKGKHSRIL